MIMFLQKQQGCKVDNDKSDSWHRCHYLDITKKWTAKSIPGITL